MRDRSYNPGVPHQPLVELTRVSLLRNRALILSDLDLQVMPGETVVIHGPNGSGKTSLLRLVATLLAPTDGAGTVLGEDLFDRTGILRIRHQIGLVGHQPAVWPELTLVENLTSMPGMSDPRAAHEMLEVVGLGRAADRRADRASQGMQRRVEFARVRLQIPALLLLDEAHAGLDAGAVAIVEDTARMVLERGGAVVVVSHESSRIAGRIDRELRLVDGHLEPVA